MKIWFLKWLNMYVLYYCFVNKSVVVNELNCFFLLIDFFIDVYLDIIIGILCD